MTKAGVAGGPIEAGDGLPLPSSQLGAASEEDGAEDQQQTQANDQQDTEESVQAMIDKAVGEAVAEIKQEYEGPGGHLANVRSQLMTQANQREEEFDAQRTIFEEQIHQLSVRDMDEDARAKFERDLYRERAAGLAEQLSGTRDALAASQQMGTYIRGLVKSFDVDIDDLNLENVEELSETAFTAAANAHQKTLQELANATEKIQALEARDGKADVSASDVEQKAKLPEAPDVTTQTGTTTSSAPSLLDLRKSLSQGMDGLITEEQLFELAENPEESGVDLNIVLESLAAELEQLEEAV